MVPVSGAVFGLQVKTFHRVTVAGDPRRRIDGAPARVCRYKRQASVVNEPASFLRPMPARVKAAAAPALPAESNSKRSDFPRHDLRPMVSISRLISSGALA
jgi:hypothetical protein